MKSYMTKVFKFVAIPDNSVKKPEYIDEEHNYYKLVALCEDGNAYLLYDFFAYKGHNPSESVSVMRNASEEVYWIRVWKSASRRYGGARREVIRESYHIKYDKKCGTGSYKGKLETKPLADMKEEIVEALL